MAQEHLIGNTSPLAVALTMAAITVSGCVTTGPVADFKPAAVSGVSSPEFVVLPYSRSKDQLADAPDPLKDVVGDKALLQLLQQRCRTPEHLAAPPDPAAPPSPPVAAAIVPLIASVGQLAFDFYMDREKRRVEDIVESAQATYSATQVASSATLADTSCLLLVRYKEVKPKAEKLAAASAPKSGDPVAEAGMIALIELRPENIRTVSTYAVTLKPLHVVMHNAVAATREAAEPKVDLSVAISIKAIAKERSPIARLLPAGSGVVSAPGVTLLAPAAVASAGSAACSDLKCNRSDLVAFPSNHGALSITVAVTEQGKTGFNDKTALAEIAAIKAAIGPAISEAIKTKFED